MVVKMAQICEKIEKLQDILKSYPIRRFSCVNDNFEIEFRALLHHEEKIISMYKDAIIRKDYAYEYIRLYYYPKPGALESFSAAAEFAGEDLKSFFKSIVITSRLDEIGVTETVYNEKFIELCEEREDEWAVAFVNKFAFSLEKILHVKITTPINEHDIEKVVELAKLSSVIVLER